MALPLGFQNDSWIRTNCSDFLGCLKAMLRSLSEAPILTACFGFPELAFFVLRVVSDLSLRCAPNRTLTGRRRTTSIDEYAHLDNRGSKWATLVGDGLSFAATYP
jgi:hypothetical protein